MTTARETQSWLGVAAAAACVGVGAAALTAFALSCFLLPILGVCKLLGWL